MSRFILGNCVDIMAGFPERAVDFILTDPPYLVGLTGTVLSSICRMAMSLSRIRGNVSRSQILIGKMGFISQMRCLSLRKSRARNWCLAGMEGLLIQPVMWFSGLMKGAQILFR